MRRLLQTSIALLAACGAPPESKPADEGNAAANNAVVANNAAANSSSTNNVDTPPPEEEVTVDCVSDLVTQNGNYYALSALVRDEQAEVEMVHYLAATPTSDPEETIIFAELVPARFTPRLFAFESGETFLDVEATSDPHLYRGTMSGESQFADEVAVTCWSADLATAAYDPARGDCFDTAGDAARNAIPWAYAFRTGFGQCAKFVGALNGEALGYPTFDFIDLRGADLTEASLHFADLRTTQFEGADLSTFDFGYATIEGTKDAFTVLPTDVECTIAEDGISFSCTR